MDAAFTISTANYLAQAKTVADSFLEHNSEFNFFIFLLDKVNGRFDISYFCPAQVIEVESMNIEGFGEMVNSYTLFELSNALKSFAATFLFENFKDIKTIYYFDSDLFIYNPLTEIKNLLEKYNILLTPHIFTPLPLDGFLPDDKSFLNAGIYNGGFFALKRSEDTLNFLSWWKQKMKTECKIHFADGLFVDQIWLNFVPIFFKQVGFVINRGYNIAYWNLHERSIQIKNNEFFVNNSTPLVFFHFSGFDLNDTTLISKYQTRFSFEQRPDVEPLFKTYKDCVLHNNHHLFNDLECYYLQQKQKFEEDKKLFQEEQLRMKNKITLKRIVNALIRRMQIFMYTI